MQHVPLFHAVIFSLLWEFLYWSEDTFTFKYTLCCISWNDGYHQLFSLSVAVIMNEMVYCGSSVGKSQWLHVLSRSLCLLHPLWLSKIIIHLQCIGIPKSNEMVLRPSLGILFWLRRDHCIEKALCYIYSINCILLNVLGQLPMLVIMNELCVVLALLHVLSILWAYILKCRHVFTW